MGNKCTICGTSDFIRIFFQPNVPVCTGVALNKNEIGFELLSDLEIVQCQLCTHIYNNSFKLNIIEELYKNNYSPGLAVSTAIIKRFQNIISNAITEEKIRNKLIVEIGASDFTFSEMLLERGAKEIIAFEPSGLFKTNNTKIIHINEYFSFNYLPKDIDKIDLIVMRHVLEHMNNPISELKQIGIMLDVGSSLYIEVPNVNDILQKNRFYDFFHEHINYFSPELLEHILKLFGFEIVKYSEFVNGQHFGLLCKKMENKNNLDYSKFKFSSIKSSNKIKQFNMYSKKFLKELSNIFKKYKKIAVYGAGSHSIYLNSILKLTNNNIKFIIDANRLKENKYLPGAHIIVKSPSKQILKDLEVIVIMASLHQIEIHNDLRNKFKFKGMIFGTYPSLLKMS